MTKADKKRLLDFLKAHPDLEVVAHPNPVGLGPRRFLRVVRDDVVFARPDQRPSYLALKPGTALAFSETGFTVDGLITYRARA